SLTALLAAARTLAAAAGLLESEERNVLAKYFLLAGAALAALLLFENATNGPITRLFHDFPGKMDDHMPSLNPGAAILAVLAWPLVMAAARWRGWRWGILVLAVVAVAVFMARTKTPIIALFLSVLLFPVLAAGGRKAVRVFGALAAGFLIAAPFIYRFLLFPVAAQGEAQAKIMRSMPTLEQRTWIWRFVVERIEQHPFLGWGLDASRFIEGGHEPMKGYDGRMFPESLPLHPHNGFLQIWLELGGVGAVLIAVALAALLFAIGKTSGNAKMAAAFFAMAVTYLVIGQVSFGVWQNWWLATAILSTSLCLMMSTSDGKKR
ncbi:MAG TPA: O-antigen ligase domain-containing protein, partial [Rhodospirillales bacterium]|nr:O-antigen ligase domain-containing protein [Rhodospirillales bacterium]